MKCLWGVLKKAMVSVAACMVGRLALLILLMVIGSLREARMHKGVPDFIDAAERGDYVRLKIRILFQLLLILHLTAIASGYSMPHSIVKAAPSRIPPSATLSEAPHPTITPDKTPPSSSPAPDWQDSLAEGMEKVIDGHYEKALPPLLRAKKEKPKYGEIHFWLFQAYKNIEYMNYGHKISKKSNAFLSAKNVVKLMPGTTQARQAQEFIDRVNLLDSGEMGPEKEIDPRKGIAGRWRLGVACIDCPELIFLDDGTMIFVIHGFVRQVRSYAFIDSHTMQLGSREEAKSLKVNRMVIKRLSSRVLIFRQIDKDGKSSPEEKWVREK
jgi:hypothetical protein